MRDHLERARSCASSACASSCRPATTATSPSGSSSARRRTSPPSPTRSTAAASRTSSSAAAARPAPTPSAAGACRTSRSASRAAHDHARARRTTTATVTARWIVDASGRANLLRRKLDLGTETGHHINAAWFRLAGGLDFEEWGDDDEEWLDRMPERGLRALDHPPDRRRLLAVADPARLGADQHRRLRRPALPSVRGDRRVRRLPRLDEASTSRSSPRRSSGAATTSSTSCAIEDFSYASSRSSRPTAGRLVGEAAGFIDALYSPGSDFIALHQHLQHRADHARPRRRGHRRSASSSTTTSSSSCSTRRSQLYKDKYQLFGNPQVMVAKVVYDSLAYFSSAGVRRSSTGR